MFLDSSLSRGSRSWMRGRARSRIPSRHWSDCGQSVSSTLNWPAGQLPQRRFWESEDRSGKLQSSKPDLPACAPRWDACFSPVSVTSYCVTELARAAGPAKSSASVASAAGRNRTVEPVATACPSPARPRSASRRSRRWGCSPGGSGRDTDCVCRSWASSVTSERGPEFVSPTGRHQDSRARWRMCWAQRCCLPPRRTCRETR
jgi:hypothetical protein